MHLNALITFLLPLAAGYGLSWYWRFVRHEDDRWPRVSQAAVSVVLAAPSIFTVLRNLPVRLFHKKQNDPCV
jgi:hypothetical protein